MVAQKPGESGRETGCFGFSADRLAKTSRRKRPVVLHECKEFIGQTAYSTPTSSAATNPRSIHQLDLAMLTPADNQSARRR